MGFIIFLALVSALSTVIHMSALLISRMSSCFGACAAPTISSCRRALLICRGILIRFDPQIFPQNSCLGGVASELKFGDLQLLDFQSVLWRIVV